MERFYSKRNQVFFRGGVVVKRLPSPEAAAAEAELLREYYRAGADVPRVLDICGQEIMMEYIPGETIPDFLARMEAEGDDKPLSEAAQGLSRWFGRFYEAVDHARGGEIRGDVNGRNFIIAGGRVVSVDFEERAFGPAEQDIGRLLAFIHTYDLAGSYVKRRFASLFYDAAADRLNLSAAEILRQYRKERAAMRKRRRQD